VFSVLDMKQAYHQIPIAKESQPYLTVNTHIGLFAFKRLPNGIHSGPAIFQRIMDNLLSDIPKAVSRLDDILGQEQIKKTIFTLFLTLFLNAEQGKLQWFILVIR